MNWLEILKPVLYAVFSALAMVLGYYIKKLGSKLVEYMKSKLGAETYDSAFEVATGLYIYLEDKYGDSFKKMGLEKKEEMEKLLLEKFPTLTQAELDSINKRVWLSFQEGYAGSYEAPSKDTVAIEGE